MGLTSITNVKKKFSQKLKKVRVNQSPSVGNKFRDKENKIVGFV